MATTDGTVVIGKEAKNNEIIQEPEAVEPIVESDGTVPINLQCCSDKGHEHTNKAILDAITQETIDRINSDRVISVESDNVAHTLTFGFKDGVNKVIDLSALANDIHISEATLNNQTLVLKDNDGNDITVDLSSFVTAEELATAIESSQHTHDNKDILDAINQAFIDRVNSDRVISVTNDNVAHTITFGFKDSEDYVIDLSALTTDIHIASGSLNGETLVLKDSDGNDITIDLSAFMKDDSLVDGYGTTVEHGADNIKIDVNISNIDGNILEVDDHDYPPVLQGKKGLFVLPHNIYTEDGAIGEHRTVTIDNNVLTFDGKDNDYPAIEVVSESASGGTVRVKSKNSSGEFYAHDNYIGLYSATDDTMMLSYSKSDKVVSIGRVFGGNVQYRTDFRVLKQLQDYNGNAGTDGQVLVPKIDGGSIIGVEWKDLPEVDLSQVGENTDSITTINTDIESLESSQHTHDNKAILDAINQAFVDRVNSDRVISVESDNVAHTITFGFKDGADVVIDLSSLANDIHINDMELSGETLILKDSDGETISLDLSKFLTVDDIVDGNVIKPTIVGDKVSLDLSFFNNATDDASMLEVIGDKLLVRSTFRDAFGNFPANNQILTTVQDGGFTKTKWVDKEAKLYANGGRYSWSDPIFTHGKAVPFDEYKTILCSSSPNDGVLVIEKDCTIKIEFSIMVSTILTKTNRGDDILVWAYINGKKLPLPSWAGEDEVAKTKWRRESGNTPMMTQDVKKGDKIRFTCDMTGAREQASGVFSFVIEEV